VAARLAVGVTDQNPEAYGPEAIARLEWSVAALLVLCIVGYIRVGVLTIDCHAADPDGHVAGVIR
jgi:hypothetical protein